MFKKLIMHVGVGKTGSSSIQKYLESYAEDKKKSGDIFYPTCFDGNSLFSEYLSHCCYPTKDEKKIMEIKEYLLSRVEDGSLCIISGEILTHSNQILKSRVFDLLREIFDEIRVIAYVREPSKWNASTAAQLLLDGISLNHLEKWPYLETQYGLLKFYHEVAIEYDDVKFSVHKFEDSISLNGGIVENFCSLVNDYYNGQVLFPPTETFHVNRAKTKLEYMVLGYANELLKYEGQLQKRELFQDLVEYLASVAKPLEKKKMTDAGFSQFDLNSNVKIAIEYDRVMLYNNYGIQYDFEQSDERSRTQQYTYIIDELKRCRDLSELKNTAEILFREFYS